MSDARRGEAARRAARLPPLLLAAVAASQLWLVHRADLAPWSGGGFGMFSTVDNAAHRHLHAWAIRAGSRRELEIPDALRDAQRAALALPSDARLRALAQALAEVEAREAPGYEGPLDAIEVQVFRTLHEPDTLAPRSERLRGLSVPFEAR